MCDIRAFSVAPSPVHLPTQCVSEGSGCTHTAVPGCLDHSVGLMTATALDTPWTVCVCDDRKLHQCFCTVCTYIHSMHIVCTTHCVCTCVCVCVSTCVRAYVCMVSR